MENMRITKDMSIGETIKKYPQIVPILLKYNLTCMGCPMAMRETIEMGAKAHGIDVRKLVKELNEAIID